VSVIATCLEMLGAEIAARSAAIGRRVNIGALGVSDRGGHIALGPPDHRSPNRATQMVRASDGWIAVNMAREDDREMLPAWLGGDIGTDFWEAIAEGARRRPARDLVDAGVLLGIPVARVCEVAAADCNVPLITMAQSGRTRREALRVVDLSALWAGPLVGSVFAALGASVMKVESSRRADPTWESMPRFNACLNGGKTLRRHDLTSPAGQADLHRAVLEADVLVTSARPRAFEGLGLSPRSVFADNPDLIWVAVTGYGWEEPGASRVAFGDDAAAAGGLVGWDRGAPQFLGDALADPVTGLAGAAGALRVLEAGGGGVIVDAAMARCAAGAAAVCGLARAA